jgi:hypothetical protein
MKRKIIFTIIGLSVFLSCFIASVLINDYFAEQRLRKNIHHVEVGMTEKEVIKILGKPSNVFMSDTSASCWCYDTDSIAQTLDPQPEISCNHLLLQMNSDSRMVKVIGFKD